MSLLFLHHRMFIGFFFFWLSLPFLRHSCSCSLILSRIFFYGPCMSAHIFFNRFAYTHTHTLYLYSLHRWGEKKNTFFLNETIAKQWCCFQLYVEWAGNIPKIEITSKFLAGLDFPVPNSVYTLFHLSTFCSAWFLLPFALFWCAWFFFSSPLVCPHRWTSNRVCTFESTQKKKKGSCGGDCERVNHDAEMHE